MEAADLPATAGLSPLWLDRLAGLWPDRVVLTIPDSDTSYTFGDLRTRALATAASLSQRGVGPGDRVAALLHNGVEMLDLLFACAYIGAILAPLNWRLSSRELQVLLDDLEPGVLVYEQEFADVAAASALRDTVLMSSPTDTSELSPESGSAPFPPADISLETPWMILYTGGTTGTPKGAVLTHGSILWNAINTAVSWGLSERDVAPSFTPMFHTGGFNVFTLPLLMLGGRVILPRRFDAAEALHVLESEQATVVFMVPTMFQLVAQQPGFQSADLGNLRWAISGGAPLPAPVHRLWSDKVALFKQGYGLTEVGPNNFATPGEWVGRKPGSVGRLTFLARARIVDDAGEDVPEGEPGELLLAGPHVCAGYWRRPDATRDAIRGGWFHTGDVARRDEDGFYYIVDRKKDMIITGGENVYPSEVEAVLYAHASVRETAVVGVPDDVWGEAVCAVIAIRDCESSDPGELRDYTRANLAGYKVPKHFVFVDDVPKSAAGKILRTEARKLAVSVPTD